MGKTVSPSRNAVRPRKKLRIASKAIKVLRNIVTGTFRYVVNKDERDCITIHESPPAIKISPSETRAIHHLLVELSGFRSRFSCSSLIARDSVALALRFKFQVAERKRALAASRTAIFTVPLDERKLRVSK